MVAPLETFWPHTVVLGSTEFLYTGRMIGERSQLFCLLFAYGYLNRCCCTGSS